ncbi:response regulator transcription factor [Chromobacterium subtsugae]|uniref:response regulator transcription factor n=1 Tax=Chromobacterium subtsugae TaxID=251747 RepID=UPI000640FFEA|nr:response regulator transcription factor [Chromobacterium subtsugae]
MTIRIIVGDDHALLREGLAALLQRETDMEVQAQAANGAELLQLARQLQPDVVIADINMPLLNGVEVAARLRAESLPCKTLCLSASDRPQTVRAALDAGAAGYVLKENAYAELARGIRRVMANQIFLSGELVAGLVHPSFAGALEAEQIKLPQLSPRERQVTQLFAEGYSTQAIAAQLHLSPKTVATHREHIFRKLGIGSIAELTRYVLREGW